MIYKMKTSDGDLLTKRKLMLKYSDIHFRMKKGLFKSRNFIQELTFQEMDLLSQDLIL